MNEHLSPIFKIILPAIEKAEIVYGVFGGIGITAYAGEFFRENEDVDIFVLEESYGRTIDIVEKLY